MAALAITGLASLSRLGGYIIRHGVRWTGMPAFPNLTEEDAWHMAEMVQSKAGKLVTNSVYSGPQQSKHLEGK